jgi:hypothetical protein
VVRHGRRELAEARTGQLNAVETKLATAQAASWELQASLAERAAELAAARADASAAAAAAAKASAELRRLQATLEAVQSEGERAREGLEREREALRAAAAEGQKLLHEAAAATTEAREGTAAAGKEAAALGCALREREALCGMRACSGCTQLAGRISALCASGLLQQAYGGDAAGTGTWSSGSNCGSDETAGEPAALATAATIPAFASSGPCALENAAAAVAVDSAMATPPCASTPGSYSGAAADSAGVAPAVPPACISSADAELDHLEAVLRAAAAMAAEAEQGRLARLISMLPDDCPPSPGASSLSALPGGGAHDAGGGCNCVVGDGAGGDGRHGAEGDAARGLTAQLVRAMATERRQLVARLRRLQQQAAAQQAAQAAQATQLHSVWTQARLEWSLGWHHQGVGTTHTEALRAKKNVTSTGGSAAAGAAVASTSVPAVPAAARDEAEAGVRRRPPAAAAAAGEQLPSQQAAAASAADALQDVAAAGPEPESQAGGVPPADGSWGSCDDTRSEVDSVLQALEAYIMPPHAAASGGSRASSSGSDGLASSAGASTGGGRGDGSGGGSSGAIIGCGGSSGALMRATGRRAAMAGGSFAPSGLNSRRLSWGLRGQKPMPRATAGSGL